MPHAIDCPACGGHFKVPDGIWERRIEGQLSHLVCKKCKHNIEIDDRQKDGSPKIRETTPPQAKPASEEPKPQPEPAPEEVKVAPEPEPAPKPAPTPKPADVRASKPEIPKPAIGLPKPEIKPKPADARSSKPEIIPKPPDVRQSKPEIAAKPAGIRQSRPELGPKPVDVRPLRPDLLPKPVPKPADARQSKPELPKLPTLRQSTPDTPLAKLTGPRATATETPLPAQPLPRFPPPKPLKDADIRATRPDREPPPKPKGLAKDAPPKPTVIREGDDVVTSAPERPKSTPPKAKSERPKAKSEPPKVAEEKRRSVRPVALDSGDVRPAAAVESPSASKGRGLTIAALVVLIVGVAWWLFRPTGDTSSIQPRTETVQSRAPAPTAPPPASTAEREPEPPPVKSATPALGSAAPDVSQKPAKRKRPVSWPEKRYVPSSI